MIDDHDRYGGQMFILVLAHPGCPRQNPKSSETVVCVWGGVRACMCVHACIIAL